MLMLSSKIKNVSNATHGYVEVAVVDFVVALRLVLGCFFLVRKLKLLGAGFFLPVSVLKFCLF